MLQRLAKTCNNWQKLALELSQKFGYLRRPSKSVQSQSIHSPQDIDMEVRRYRATNSFTPSISCRPPQMSMVTESLEPKYCPRLVPRPLWEHNLKPLLLVHPNGITIPALEELFCMEYGKRMMPELFGYHNTEELLNDIKELCVTCKKVFLDWGHWPQELP